MEEDQLKIVKELVEEFLQKMTVRFFNIETNVLLVSEGAVSKEVLHINLDAEEPQILIGQNGQTLFELQRLLMVILNKKLGRKDSGFYVDLDINDYKKKKIEYLKNTAEELADQVAKDKEKKMLPPMSAYERRIVHAQLAQRQDVITGSEGEGRKDMW